ncbi:hypothetical protein IWW55_002718 [Coemansia sp. RSA 2706]|nr:hypothetical protein IWW55_002718 [Coemansia sp. RSA 2706]
MPPARWDPNNILYIGGDFALTTCTMCEERFLIYEYQKHLGVCQMMPNNEHTR